MKYIIALIAALAIIGQQSNAADADATTRERQRILTDTNATTTITNYTATGAGQLLAGKVGSTNAVWISTSSGVNSWVKIAQQ